ncbi:MAG: FHA domain-containing protein [Deltaproteobacteria bacterium]|nr:FHA domain-containing protein [Deltaproteobacteria bacterium]
MNEYQSNGAEPDESREMNPEIMEPGTEPEEVGGPESWACLVLNDGGRLELSGDEVVIGRTDPLEGIHPDLDLGVRGGLEMGVSRRHATIFREDEKFSLEDLGSTNGTIINRERVQAGDRVTLNEGDVIYLGRFKAVFQTPHNSGGSQ